MEARSTAYRPATPFAKGTRYVFAEFANSHGNLFDLYGDIPGAQFVELPGRAWIDDPSRAIAYLGASMPPDARCVVLLSLDVFSCNASRAELLKQGIEQWRIPTLAIQHRIPTSNEQLRGLLQLSHQLRCIVTLSEGIAVRLKTICPSANVVTVPLHPSKFRYLSPDNSGRSRTKIGAESHYTVFGMIGEAREGKGLELLLDAIDHMPRSTLESAFFLLAGKSQHLDPDLIAMRLSSRGALAKVDLRISDDPTKYELLTSSEYVSAIEATDVGILLYQGDQRIVASGVLSDFIWSRKFILATSNSLVGSEVSQHKLGMTLDVETPETLASLITEITGLHQRGALFSKDAEKYRDAHSPTATLTAITDILDSVTYLA